MEASGSASVQIMMDPDPGGPNIRSESTTLEKPKTIWQKYEKARQFKTAGSGDRQQKTAINRYVAEGTWKWRGFWWPWGGRPVAADTSQSRAGRDGPAASGTAPRRRSDRNPPDYGKEEKPVREEQIKKSFTGKLKLIILFQANQQHSCINGQRAWSYGYRTAVAPKTE